MINLLLGDRREYVTKKMTTIKATQQYTVKPWEHQRIAIEAISETGIGGLRFDPGCGKTATYINIVRKWCNQERRILRGIVFTPSIVLENFRREFDIHAPKLSEHVGVLSGSIEKRIKELRKYPIVITNIEAIRYPNFLKAAIKEKFDFMVVDECHRCKDPKATQTKRIHQLADRIPRRLAGTGTLFLRSPLDFWAQQRILSSSALPSNYYEFLKVWCYDENASKPWLGFPSWKLRKEKEKDFQAIVDKWWFSANKHEVLDLPPLLTKKVHLELETAQKRHYHELEKDFLTYLKDEKCVTTTAVAKCIRLMQVSSGILPLTSNDSIEHVGTAKLNALRELLRDIVPTEKVIVWSVWAPTYSQIEQICEEVGCDSVQLTGETPMKERQKNIDRFNNEDDCRVLIGNPGAGGIGVNLIAASTMIYYSKDFTLEKDVQSEARAHRAGSERHKRIYRIDLITKGTIEEAIEENRIAKLSMAEFFQQMRKAA